MRTMVRFAKWLLFSVYAFIVHTKWIFTPRGCAAGTFIWKHAWFFFWHRFFWALGRLLLARLIRVRPLACELAPDTAEHERRFNELAGRDFSLLKLEERIFRPTHFRLAEDTARELCLLYAAFAACAPWQYGVAARIAACKNMRNMFLAACACFCVSIVFYDAASVFSVRCIFFSFFAAFIVAAGWYASACIRRIALAAAVLSPTHDTPKRPS